MKTLTGFPLRATCTTNVAELSAWCKEYHETTRYPSDFLTRFSIGIYQLGDDWNEKHATYREYEYLAAASIHFICCLEACGSSFWQAVPLDLYDLAQLETKPIDHKMLLKLICKAQKMLFYRYRAFQKGYHRASRFNQKDFEEYVTRAVIMIMASIPSYRRGEAIEQATAIMTGKL